MTQTRLVVRCRSMPGTVAVLKEGAALMQAIREDGKVAFDVNVDIKDNSGDTVVEMTVNWYVSAAR